MPPDRSSGEASRVQKMRDAFRAEYVLKREASGIRGASFRRSGRYIAGEEQGPHNPPVVGSSPTRPTEVGHPTTRMSCAFAQIRLNGRTS